MHCTTRAEARAKGTVIRELYKFAHCCAIMYGVLRKVHIPYFMLLKRYLGNDSSGRLLCVLLCSADVLNPNPDSWGRK
jgi:hypothetical protein